MIKDVSDFSSGVLGLIILKKQTSDTCDFSFKFSSCIQRPRLGLQLTIILIIKCQRSVKNAYLNFRLLLWSKQQPKTQRLIIYYHEWHRKAANPPIWGKTSSFVWKWLKQLNDSQNSWWLMCYWSINRLIIAAVAQLQWKFF